MKCLKWMILILLALPLPALADGPSIGVGLRIEALNIEDEQRDPISGVDTLPVIGVMADIEPARGLIPGRLRVGLEYNYLGEESTTLFQTLEADWSEHHILATVDYGWEVTDYLVPYAKVTLGLGFYEVGVEDFVAARLEATDYGLFSGSAGAGLELLFPYSFWGSAAEPSGDNTDVSDAEVSVGDNSFGLRLELGHTFRQNPEFVVEQSHDTPEEAEEIPLEGARLGTLPVNGLYFSVDFFVRF